MRTLEMLFRKKRRLVVGLMSGTSADGMDAALASISGSGAESKVRLLAFRTFPYPSGYKEHLLRHSSAATARIEEITRLNMLVAEFSAEAVRRIARSGGHRLADIDLIGSHGQTIHHLPTPVTLFGHRIRGTLQIGDPSVIAKRTGIVTVGGFRTGDLAVGGTGAPLVPLFDYLMLRSTRVSRGVLNIGGIANLTLLPRDCSAGEVLAFDTGPGNMIVDALMAKYFRRPFDRDGAVAWEGRIIPRVLRSMAAHPYFRRPAPKSTGREAFGAAFLRGVLAAAPGSAPEDLVATATEFTAYAVYQQYLAHAARKARMEELYVSGGGIHNGYLMDALARYFGPVPVRSTGVLAVPPDAKEAVCFALLANETIAGHPGNIPGATGARRRTILGTIALP
jgi:anhydro-N-acetylmuramic acid kinase